MLEYGMIMGYKWKQWKKLLKRAYGTVFVAGIKLHNFGKVEVV